jgi:predicted ATPase
LQISLAIASAATQGYGASEVEMAYSRARELCLQSGDTNQIFPVLWGLFRFYLIRSDFGAARELAAHFLQLAEKGEDLAPVVEAHLAAGCAFVNLGEFPLAREHFDRGLALYDSSQEEAHLFLYGHDPRVVHRCFNGWALWSLGYPDKALETVGEALRLAEALHHPETHCFALFFSAWVHQLRRESRQTLERARAANDLATKSGLAQWIAFSSSLIGWALAAEGESRQGIEQMRRTLAAYRAIGSEISRPHFLGLLAEALMSSGQLDDALASVTEALAVADNTDHRYYESELHRLRGEIMLALIPEAEAEAETSFRRAIKVAQKQKARSFELRARLSLGRIRQRQGRGEEARCELAAVYDAFDEGFDTRDLTEARALLDELSD